MDADLERACDGTRSVADRRIAWESYEIKTWMLAVRDRGLYRRNLEYDMKEKVYKYLCASLDSGRITERNG